MSLHVPYKKMDLKLTEKQSKLSISENLVFRLFKLSILQFLLTTKSEQNVLGV